MSEAQKEIAPKPIGRHSDSCQSTWHYRDAELLRLCARDAVLRNRCETVGIDICRCPMRPDAYNRFRLTTAMIKMEVEQ
jgi:hypothetical protein